MDQDQGAEFVRNGEETIQTGIGELGAGDLRADLDTEEAPAAHAPANLVDGLVGVLEGDRGQRGEAGRVPVNDPGEEVVLCGRQFGGAGGRRPVAERHRNRRKQLHSNAFAIHVGDPSIR